MQAYAIILAIIGLSLLVGGSLFGIIILLLALLCFSIL